jgi:hypothetical protein
MGGPPAFRSRSQLRGALGAGGPPGARSGGLKKRSKGRGRHALLGAAAALACASAPVPPGTPERAEARCQAHPAGLPEAGFSTDGCSSWPDAAALPCCIEHDIAYWCGGSCEERAAADRELRRCVAERTGALGWLMWAGVRVGGHPVLPLPWRWGYGRRWPTLYLPPAPADRKTE